MAHKYFALGNIRERFPEASKQSFYDAMAPTVVFIKAGRGNCFGGVIIPGDRVLTLYNKVEPAILPPKTKKRISIKVRLFNGKHCKAEIERVSEDCNLALLTLDEANLDYARVTESKVFIEQEVHAIGHAQGGKFEYDQGYVSNLNVLFSQIAPVLTTRVPTNISSLYTLPLHAIGGLVLERLAYVKYNQKQSFCYGSPIFDSRGFIVGLCNFFTLEGLHYFIPSEKIKQFIDAGSNSVA